MTYKKQTIPIKGYTINDMINQLDLINTKYSYHLNDDRIDNERKGQFGELVLGYALQNFGWSLRPNGMLLEREYIVGKASPSNNHGIDWRLVLDTYPVMTIEVKNLGFYTWIDQKFYDNDIRDRFLRHCYDPQAIKACVVNKKAITKTVQKWFHNDGINIIPIIGQIEYWNYNDIKFITQVYDDHIKEIESLYKSQGCSITRHLPIFDSLLQDLGRKDATIQCLKMGVPDETIRDEYGYSNRQLSNFKYYHKNKI